MRTRDDLQQEIKQLLKRLWSRHDAHCEAAMDAAERGDMEEWGRQIQEAKSLGKLIDSHIRVVYREAR